MNQMVYDTSTNILAIYHDSEKIKTIVTPVNALQSYLLHCIDWNQNLLFSGQIQNYQYDSEGMLVKSDPMGKEIWRRYYGKAGLDCGIGEPFILDDNIILLPGNKSYWPDSGPIINKWTKTWIAAVDSLGNIKNEWESPKNVENGVATRMLKMDDGNWLYTTSEFVPMLGQIDDFGLIPKIVCRDSGFNLVWERYISSYPTSGSYTIDLHATLDGNFIIVGRIGTDEWWGGCIIHKFSPSGDSIWTYLDSCEPVFGCYHYLGGVAELPSGSVVAAGYYENVDEAKAYGLLIKLDKNGCMDALCAGTNGTYEIELANKIKVYPNPTSSIINILNPIGEKVELFDVTGKNMKEIKVSGDKQVIDIQELPSGIYLLKMREKTLHVTYKITKQ